MCPYGLVEKINISFILLSDSKFYEIPINVYELKIFYPKLFHFNSLLSKIIRPHFICGNVFLKAFCFTVIYKTSKQWTKKTHSHTHSEQNGTKKALDKNLPQKVHNNFLLFIFIYLYDVVVIL